LKYYLRIWFLKEPGFERFFEEPFKTGLFKERWFYRFFVEPEMAP